MYSVFLVEDEIVIRDGLKTSFPWEQHGFTYVGDAEDGEMALPLIRQTKPDVIITDIKMPFMDGIALSKLVKKELPTTRIIIISGFDDFSYAQEAISIGVDNYLLKPITKDKLSEVMKDAKTKLDEASEKDNYYEQYQLESQEYEKFARVRFFNQLTGGALSVQEVYEKSEELGLNLDARVYNLLLLDFTPITGSNDASAYSKRAAKLSEALLQYFKCCPEYMVFHISLNTYAIIIKGDNDSIERLTENCINNISRRCLEYEDEVSWYVSVGLNVTRFSEFSQSLNHANKKLSSRYINPECHVITDDALKAIENKNQQDESVVIDQHLVGVFLENALIEEIDPFLDQLLMGNSKKALSSMLFCQYFAMTMYVCACDYINKLGSDPSEILPPDIRKRLEGVNAHNTFFLVRDMFSCAISKRMGDSNKQYKNQLVLAKKYIDGHFSDSNLNLNEVAKEVNISPSYLSAMFSRELDTTFVEYVTQKRMEQAKYMLKNTQEKSAVIAETVGYKDPHYFSYIFKKCFGCSPKEYRNQSED